MYALVRSRLTEDGLLVSDVEAHGLDREGRVSFSDLQWAHLGVDFQGVDGRSGHPSSAWVRGSVLQRVAWVPSCSVRVVPGLCVICQHFALDPAVCSRSKCPGGIGQMLSSR